MESSKEIQQLFIDDVRSKAMYTGKRATGSARVMFASQLYIPKEESAPNMLDNKMKIWLRWNEFTKKPKHEQCSLLKLWVNNGYSPMDIANQLHCKLNNITALLKFHKIVTPMMPKVDVPEPVEVIFKPLPDISYVQFKLLPDVERIARYDVFKDALGTERKIAEIWQIPTLTLSNIMSGTRKRVKNGVARNDNFNKHRTFEKVIHKEEEEMDAPVKPMEQPNVIKIVEGFRDQTADLVKELTRLYEVERKYKKIREALAEV